MRAIVITRGDKMMVAWTWVAAIKPTDFADGWMWRVKRKCELWEPSTERGRVR